MSEQPAANVNPTPDAETKQSVPFYRNPWLNAVIVVLGVFVDPLILIWSLIMMWTGAYYYAGFKRPYKPMGKAFKFVFSLLILGFIAFTYLPVLARMNVAAGCSSNQAIALVKQIAKRQTIAAVSYDQVEVSAIRTIGNGRPNGGVACAAEMTNIRLGNGMAHSSGITYTVDPTDARDQVVVNLSFDNR